MNIKHRNTLLVATGLIIIVALSRFLPHPHNFTPIGAMALFGAAHFRNKLMAIAIPLLALFFSDLVINNTIYAASTEDFQVFGNGYVYLGFILIAGLGFLTLTKVKPLTVLSSSVGASIIFFLVTNFGSWASYAMYPKNFAGLMSSYAAGLPFFWNTLAGDVFYCTVMFGAYYLISRQVKDRVMVNG